MGLDLRVEPSSAEVTWALTLDGRPWPAQRVYGGTLGVVMGDLAGGVVGDRAREEASAEGMPWIDPENDLGMFVARDATGQVLELGGSDAAKREAMGLMRSWGYVR